MTYDIKKITTRQLLSWLRAARKRESLEIASRPPSGGDNALPPYTVQFSIDQIKAELSSREHVPSKAEGKELRREAAKRKR